MDITFEFACRDDCLELMVPSDLRGLVAERDRLRAELTATKGELEALKAAHTWQPIETAPKDGTTVLIFGDGETSIAFWEVRVGIGDWRCLGFGIMAFEDGASPYSGASRLLHDNPTHWMPLPPTEPVEGE